MRGEKFELGSWHSGILKLERSFFGTTDIGESTIVVRCFPWMILQNNINYRDKDQPWTYYKHTPVERGLKSEPRQIKLSALVTPDSNLLAIEKPKNGSKKFQKPLSVALAWSD